MAANARQLPQNGTATAPPQKPAALAKADPAGNPAVWEKPTNKSGLEALAPAVLKQLERGLPRFLIGQGDRLVRCMITEAQKNPALLDCTPISLFGGVIAAGQLGLTIGGPLGHAYLLPFFNNKKKAKEAQLVVGYKGFLDLAHRSDKLARLSPRVVRRGEHFAVRYGTDQKIEHVPERNCPGEESDYYVTVELVNGGKDFETFTREEALAFRDRHATVRNAPAFVRDNSPWYDMSPFGGFAQMALKTLVRRLAKRLPLSVDIGTAAGLDEMADYDKPQELGRTYLPEFAEAAEREEPPADRARELADKLDKAKQPAPPAAAPDPDSYDALFPDDPDGVRGDLNALKK